MTGNTVLLGIAVIKGDWVGAERSALAFAGFVVGVAIAAAVDHGRVEFLLEAALLVAVAALAVVIGKLPLIALAAAAMGVQTATVRRSSPPGVNVTYVTGTTTSMVSRWSARLLRHRHDDDPRLPSLVWVAYLAGGLSGAALLEAIGAAGFALPAAAAVAFSVLVRSGIRTGSR